MSGALDDSIDVVDAFIFNDLENESNITGFDNFSSNSSGNWSNFTTECLNFQQTSTSGLETILFGIALPAFDLIGFVANYLNFIALANRRHLPAPTYIYLGAISFVHAFALASQAAELALLHFLFDSAITGYAVCYFFWPVTAYISNLSACLYVAATSERYSYYSRTMTSSQISQIQIAGHQKHARIVISLVVITTLVANFPEMSAYSYNADRHCLEPRWLSQNLFSWFPFYQYLRILILSFTILVVMVVFQALLIGALKRKIEPTKTLLGAGTSNASNPAPTLLHQQERALTKSLVAFIFFCISIELLMLLLNPFAISNFWMKLITPLEDAQLRGMVIKLVKPLASIEYSALLFFNLAFNPTFRQRMKTVFCCASKSTAPNNQTPLPIKTRNSKYLEEHILRVTSL